MDKKILIVDDDPVIRLLISEYLESSGYTNVEVLDSGTACLKWLKTETPDVLLLDLIMPDMTGIDVLKQIRKNPTTSKLPVVMLSANTNTQSVVDSNKVSADQYLQKPFEMKDIITAIEEQLK